MNEKKQKLHKNFTSLSFKIIRGISIPIIIIFLVAGLLIVGTVRSSVNKLAETELTVKSQAASYQVSEFFTKYISAAEQLAANNDFEEIIKKSTGGTRMHEFPEYETVLKGLTKTVKTDPENIMGVWIGSFAVSQALQSDGFITDEGWDITQRPWYKVKETKSVLLTPPYEDASNGNMVITVAAPVYDSESNDIIGAAGIDIMLSQISTIMKDYTLGDSGSFLLTDSEGNIIYHSDEANINKPVSDIGLSDNIVQNIINNNTVFCDYTYGSQPNYGYVSMVGTTNWNVTSMLPKTEFNASVNTLALMVIGIFIIGLFIIIFMIRAIALSVVKPLKNLTDASKEIAAGNLDVNVQVESNDEIGELGQAITDTVTRLKDYIRYIKEISSVLDNIADGNLKFHLEYDYTGEFSLLKTGLLNIQAKLTDTLSHINTVAEQVLEGANQISKVANSLAESSSEQADSIEKLGQSLTHVESLTASNKENAESANESAQQASSYLDEGNQKISSLTNTMKEISDTSQKINGIIEIMNDISTQTNLLSLNAAIEAARAGEAGRGFAVVAGEVGSLANQSTSSSQETGSLILEILAAIQKGTSAAEETAKTMLDVMEHAKSSSVKISGISEAVNQEKEAIHSLKLETDQITAVIENNMAISEESVAASEELSSQAATLKSLVDEFQI